MDVLFVMTEADPFIKTGGLGEVGGSLPSALAKLGINVRVILPKYTQIKESLKSQMKPLAKFEVELSWRKQYCGLEEMVHDGIHYYFIDNEYYFKRAGIYGDYDQAEQFAYYCRAVLDSLVYMSDFKPKILHCHDWHTALVPLMLKVFYTRNAYYSSIRTVFTIHNLQYQGVFSKEVLGDIIGLGDEYYTSEQLEFYGTVNFMKAAILYADQITTVSPTYANEIKFPYYGEQIEGILYKRKDRLIGILNGIDYAKYTTDFNRNSSGSVEEFLLKKVAYKKQLQKEFGLPVKPETPIMAIVSRLVNQKGIDLIEGVFEEILQMDVQLIVLGTGEAHYEDVFRYFSSKYPDKFSLRLTFSDDLARKIYQGSDIFLMPSRFEPCGIAQMIAMHFCAIPVVRETGGLKDTVIPWNEITHEGNVFSFANYNAHEMLFTLQKAIRLFKEDKFTWQNIMQNARNCNFSWDRSAYKYLNIYKSII